MVVTDAVDGDWFAGAIYVANASRKTQRNYLSLVSPEGPTAPDFLPPELSTEPNSCPRRHIQKILKAGYHLLNSRVLPRRILQGCFRGGIYATTPLGSNQKASRWTFRSNARPIIFLLTHQLNNANQITVAAFALVFSAIRSATRTALIQFHVNRQEVFPVAEGQVDLILTVRAIV